MLFIKCIIKQWATAAVDWCVKNNKYPPNPAGLKDMLASVLMKSAVSPRKQNAGSVDCKDMPLWVHVCLFLSLLTLSKACSWMAGCSTFSSPTWLFCLSCMPTSNPRLSSITKILRRYQNLLKRKPVIDENTVSTPGWFQNSETHQPLWVLYIYTRQDGSSLSCCLHQIVTLPSESCSWNQDSSDQCFSHPLLFSCSEPVWIPASVSFS